MIRKTKPARLSAAVIYGIWLILLLIFPSFTTAQTGTLSGTIINFSSGATITGAKIQAGNSFTYSVSGGTYAIALAPGIYNVVITKAGFEDYQLPAVVINSGSLVVQNVSMNEAANPPGSSIAYVDSSLVPAGVTINWEVPEGPYELLYDDGIQDNFTIWGQQGNMNGLKFSPTGYPAKITGGKINIGTPADYAGGNPFVPFQLAIYNENSSGLPGTMISGPLNILASSTGWVDFVFDVPVIINSGNFFLVMVQGGNPPNAAGLAIDETTPSFRSFSRFVTGNGTWVPASGNFMMRVNMTGPGGPVPLLSAPVSPSNLLGYTIYRLKQGEELNPAVWSVVGYTTIHKLPDYSWLSLPCGPYRWGTRANYSSDRSSPVTFTNVIGKCWTRSVNVSASLSCDEILVSGTSVKLKNMVYPDTVYTGILSGLQVTFPTVWKGTYELTVTRFGFQPSVQNVIVNTDTSFNVFLLQERTPAQNLTVNDTSLFANWSRPKPGKELFTENWESGSFTTNAWMISGGPNWVISVAYGNPQPSAMFNYSPAASNYNQTLTSRDIHGENSAVMKLSYDICLDNFGTTTLNQLAVEIWDGTTWTLLKNYTNDDDIDWTAQQLDISGYSGTVFKIRFRAYGEDSYDINRWNIDNISILASESESVAGSCVLSYNVYLDNILCNVTTDTSSFLPPELINYGNTYTACVSAVYASGPSSPVCTQFVSRYLTPPTQLTVQAVESSAFLTWQKPVLTGNPGVTPPGLLGYIIFRNGMRADSVSEADSLKFYDDELFPGQYTYYISAKYDLSFYNSTGTAESLKEGPGEVFISYGKTLPFTESWDENTFWFNEWTFPQGQGNWIVDINKGNPAPSSTFTANPVLNDYSFVIESTIFNTTMVHCSEIWFDADFKIEDAASGSSENLAAEIFYNDSWHILEVFTNNGSTNWHTRHYDISSVKEKAFKIRFRAYGVSTSNIESWLIDNIRLYAICKEPLNPEAVSSGSVVTLTWDQPSCENGFPMNEGFEEVSFPPPGWEQNIANNQNSWFHSDASSPSGVHAGEHAASVSWDYSHQDEWLIARNVFIEGNLVFWSHAFQGSLHLDHYYVKISEDDGSTWQVLLDLSALPPYPSSNGYNQWETPYTVNLDSWQGQVLDIAWQAVDGDGQGLWYSWSVDDCSTGGKKILPLVSAAPEEYDIYRLNPGGSDFFKVNSLPVTENTFQDEVPAQGEYLYYIKQTLKECSSAISSDTIPVDIITSAGEKEAGDIILYPNPVTSTLTIQSIIPLKKIEVFDLKGSLLLVKDGNELTNLTIDFYNFPSGIYFIKILSASRIVTEKIILQK